MDTEDFDARLSACDSISEIFELVKEIIYDYLGEEQAGIMVGLSDLGKSPDGFVGAFYTPHSNMIIINQRILEKIRQSNPGLIKPYLFHILLHEYIHSIGVYDEVRARQIAYSVAEEIGNETITKLSIDMARYFSDLVRSGGLEMPEDTNVYFVKGIDRKNMSYIY